MNRLSSTFKGSSQNRPTWGRSSPVRAAGGAPITVHTGPLPFHFNPLSLRPCLMNRKPMYLFHGALPSPPKPKRPTPSEQRILWSLLLETGSTQSHWQSRPTSQPESCTRCLGSWKPGSHSPRTNSSLECSKGKLSAGLVSWGCQNK